MNEILRTTVAEVIGLQPDAVTESTTAFDVEGWDSMRHVKLILALEKKFGVRFDDSELPVLTGVSALRDSLIRHGATL